MLARLPHLAAVLIAGLTLSVAAPAHATPVCTSTPSGTTCVDPTGSCLIAIYPRFGPASCLRNPIQP